MQITLNPGKNAVKEKKRTSLSNLDHDWSHSFVGGGRLRVYWYINVCKNIQSYTIIVYVTISLIVLF